MTLGLAVSAPAFLITVNYDYDTNNFFDTQAKRDALQAAADRYSRVITSDLTAVSPAGTTTGTPAGWRVGFSHPGTGASFQLSTAAGVGSDPFYNATEGTGAADAYGFAGVAANEWVLFAGGRALSSAAVGGTGTGTNFVSTFNDLSGPMHRGVIVNTPTNTAGDLPAWGGSISFDNDGSTPWHFDTSTAAPSGLADFYSIALHEIGHALGLSLSFNQWEQFDTGGTFTGPNAVNAYNADNGASETELNQVSADNEHWQDGVYDSQIYAPGDPNYIGTVGAVGLQDLLMEPVANFTSTVRRLELTNVDVGALVDLGWSVAAIPEPGAAVFFGVVSLPFAGRYAAGVRRR